MYIFFFRKEVLTILLPLWAFPTVADPTSEMPEKPVWQRKTVLGARVERGKLGEGDKLLLSRLWKMVSQGPPLW